MKLFRRGASMAAACLLVCAGGCTSLAVMSSVPLSTMSRLSSLKLTEVDPATLRIAARLPDGFEPQRSGVKVRLETARSGATAGVVADLVLEPAGQSQETVPLLRFQRQGFRIWIYRLSEADAEHLRKLIAESAGTAGVKISAGVDACRRRPLTGAALPVSTYLKTGATDYIVLTDDLDLRNVFADGDIVARVLPCT